MTQPIQESTEEEIREVQGHYVPDGSQIQRMFYPDEDRSAYDKAIEFLSWVKPPLCQIQMGMLNNQQVVQLTYMRK